MIVDIINHLRILLTRRQKFTCCLLLFAILLAALLELLGIGLVLPVIALLTKPELIEQNCFMHALHQFLRPNSERSFFITLCVAVAVAYLLKNLILLGVNYFQSALGYSIGANLSCKLFSCYMRAQYAYHLQNNSSKLLYAITRTSELASAFIHPLIIIAAEFLIVALILLMTFLVSPLAMLGMSLCCAFIVGLVYFPLKKISAHTGEQRHLLERQEMYFVRSSLEGIKEYKVRAVEDHLIEQQQKIALHLRKVRTLGNTLGQIPRLGVEVLVIAVGLGLPVAYMLAGVSAQEIVLTLSMFFFALIRLMPSLTRIQYNLGIINSSMPMIRDILAEYFSCEIEEEQDTSPNLTFEREIALRDICFTYPGAHNPVLERFCLCIPKNAAVAFVGATGAGKTTIIDLILGLLKPQRGQVLVDEADIRHHLKAWRKLVGYVPQAIYLQDATICENVALGIERDNINEQRVKECLQQAQVYDFIAALPAGLQTVIGENGVRLSGGQRQRIGIARALYHCPQLLILDEATSALDNQTEQAFMDALATLKGKLTIIIIAHRLSTTKGCDHIVEVSALVRGK